MAKRKNNSTQELMNNESQKVIYDDSAIHNYELCSLLSYKVRHGSQIINEDFYRTLEQVIENKSWENLYVAPRQKYYQFSSLKEWIEATPPEGCGATIDTVRVLLQREQWATLKNKFELTLERENHDQENTTETPVLSSDHAPVDIELRSTVDQQLNQDKNNPFRPVSDFICNLREQGLINVKEATMLLTKKIDNDKQQQIDRAVDRIQEILLYNAEIDLHKKIAKRALKKEITQAVREELRLVNKSLVITPDPKRFAEKLNQECPPKYLQNLIKELSKQIK